MSAANANYEALINGLKPNLSVILGVDSLRGIAVSSLSVDAATHEITAALAQPTNPDFLGHMTRGTNATGLPTSDEQLFGGGLGATLEVPDKTGFQTTAEDIEMFHAEGPMLFAGSHAILSNSPAHSLVTFEDGLPRLAQVGEYAFYSILGIVTAKVDGNSFGVQFKRIQTLLVTESNS